MSEKYLVTFHKSNLNDYECEIEKPNDDAMFKETRVERIDDNGDVIISAHWVVIEGLGEAQNKVKEELEKMKDMLMGANSHSALGFDDMN